MKQTRKWKPKQGKKVLRKHPAGGAGYSNTPLQQGSITQPASAGPGTAQSVSATGTTGGTVAGP